MNYEKSAKSRKPRKNDVLNDEPDVLLDTLLSFNDKTKFQKRKSPESPDSETKRKQIEQSKDFVLQRRIKMEAKPDSSVKYELLATPLK
jgi:hypothetical protein